MERFPVWINDWLTSRIYDNASPAAQALFWRILPRLYQSPVPGYAAVQSASGPVYMDRDQILRRCGFIALPWELQVDAWDELVTWGGMVQDDKGWHNPKAVEVGTKEQAWLNEQARKARMGARARWDAQPMPVGMPGGMPGGMPTDMPTPSPSPTPSSTPDSTSPPPEGPSSPSVPGKRPPPVQVQAVFDLYRKLCVPAGLVDHPDLNPEIRKSITTRWRSRREDTILESRHRSDTLDWWEALFRLCAASAFLSGKKTDFRADLLWLTGPKNLGKILAGRYVDRAPADPYAESARKALELLGIGDEPAGNVIDLGGVS